MPLTKKALNRSIYYGHAYLAINGNYTTETVECYDFYLHGKRYGKLWYYPGLDNPWRIKTSLYTGPAFCLVAALAKIDRHYIATQTAKRLINGE